MNVKVVVGREDKKIQVSAVLRAGFKKRRKKMRQVEPWSVLISRTLEVYFGLRGLSGCSVLRIGTGFFGVGADMLRIES